METKEAAEAAVQDPNPVIDGRRANLNLAYLGVKSRIIAPTSNFSFVQLTVNVNLLSSLESKRFLILGMLEL